MSPIEKRIGHKFRNPLLLAEALTHSSLRFETKGHQFDNQRLEFLGDAVLELIITDYLFQRFGTANEGQLTKLRARIVSQDGLKSIADRINLGPYILMGKGEEANGGRTRASIIADGFESLVGAIYLDAGFESAKNFVLTEAQELITETPGSITDYNPKGHLQELLQCNGMSSPEYVLIGQAGPEHSKMFTCAVQWQKRVLGQGDGPSKKAAEMSAARNALNKKIWLRMKAVPAEAIPA